jgi:uncharacterized membrane protein YbaN (DUF454 family)
MKNPIPLQFLVGLTRLIAIYFCVRAIDQLFAGVMSYQLLQSMTRPESMAMPSPLAIYIPGLMIYIVIGVGVWFAAPLVCRIAIPPIPAEESQPDSQTCWNEVMIFLVGTLFVGTGISRLSSILITIYNGSRARVDALGYKFDFADKASMVTTVLLIGCGIILMKRFPSIHRWIQSKSLAGKRIQDGEQAVHPNGP